LRNKRINRSRLDWNMECNRLSLYTQVQM
jgi:hypothetical protein